MAVYTFLSHLLHGRYFETKTRRRAGRKQGTLEDGTCIICIDKQIQPRKDLPNAIHSDEEENAMDDEDEWTGLSNAEPMVVDSVPHIKGNKKHKPPTGVEVREMKEAENLFRSSSFKLQVRFASCYLFLCV